MKEKLICKFVQHLEIKMILDIKKVEQDYEHFKVSGIESKWFQIEDLEKVLERLNVERTLIGKSFLGKPIYKISVGSGDKKVLIWSQMHGNESTGTRAMLDVLNFFKYHSTEIVEKISFDFIPMLNPDGAHLYTRRNAVGIDMNRDFLAKSSVELKLLIQQVEQGNYEFLFNLHDQRTIFNVGNTTETATLSFLAPSYNIAQDVNAVRQKTMGVIQYMNQALQMVIPGKVGRYSSEFYPTSTGDNFTQMGYACVLFEAGHFPNDYTRNKTRKYNTLAVLKALESIANKDFYDFEEYENIPENKQKFLDVIIRNVKVESNGNSLLLDLGIYFEDYIDEITNSLQTRGILQEIGDLRNLYGLEEIDAKGEIYVGENHDFPQFQSVLSFKVGEYHFEKGIRVQ